MDELEKLKHCAGCEDDFYNDHNPYSIKRCWLLDDAKLIMRKKVHIDQVPPWEQDAREYLSCRREKRYIFVGPDQVR